MILIVPSSSGAVNLEPAVALETSLVAVLLRGWLTRVPDSVKLEVVLVGAFLAVLRAAGLRAGGLLLAYRETYSCLAGNVVASGTLGMFSLELLGFVIPVRGDGRDRKVD